ncbi:flagellar export protein FliJ [Pontibacillus yanchengensis]|uniref:Flagellar export protein FliJ n=2 Tax=Pontibacillus yanchengensis TaxID=462910 RepID=A0ACC7VBC3_9BACI|nr:flagellar export protein FliJ [Pontibacillus yanchengensis]MYL52007.1 flagellar export protein FliJ [Pontibacillus yanchengensis]
MADIATFHKLLQLKETDKNVAHKIYQESIEEFEQVATTMYELLKKKEQAEEYYQHQLQQSTQVTELHMTHNYIEQLNKQITQMQSSVQEARNHMENKQEELTFAHVEMKKYEKIIDRKEHNLYSLQMENEKKQMDEISMQQFISQGNR